MLWWLCRCWQRYDCVFKWRWVAWSREERDWRNPSCLYHRKTVSSAIGPRATALWCDMWWMWGRSSWYSIQMSDLPRLWSVQQVQDYGTAQWAWNGSDRYSVSSARGKFFTASRQRRLVLTLFWLLLRMINLVILSDQLTVFNLSKKKFTYDFRREMVQWLASVTRQ